MGMAPRGSCEVLFLAERDKSQLPAIKFVDLVKLFLENIQEKKKSRRFRLDMQARLNNVTDIHATDINLWLKEMKHTSGGTKNNYRSAPATLLSYAREFSKRYDGKGDIGAYSPENLINSSRMIFEH
jgi:hypothetical protein